MSRDLFDRLWIWCLNIIYQDLQHNVCDINHCTLIGKCYRFYVKKNIEYQITSQKDILYIYFPFSLLCYMWHIFSAHGAKLSLVVFLVFFLFMKLINILMTLCLCQEYKHQVVVLIRLIILFDLITMITTNHYLRGAIKLVKNWFF